MKTGFKLVFGVLIVLISLTDLIASGVVNQIPDTAKMVITSNYPDSVKRKPNMYLNLSSGILINNTIGNHPIINLSLGFEIRANRCNLVYEYRFGNSNKHYQTLYNDTLKSINSYKANFIGFEYQRLIFRNVNHEFYTNTGIGADWILISKNDNIKNNKFLSGLALNIGFGYAFYINGKHGPNLELLYHYVDFNNDKGTKIDNSSILIRLGYNFGNNYKKK